MDVLVIDIGGSRVKFLTSTSDQTRDFESSSALTPHEMVTRVRELTADWTYEAISIGYPGSVGARGPRLEPGNLGTGWVGFDFEEAFGVPVRVVNDAVMQAIGGYDGGRMLFLGLGTGLGSALVTEHVAVPLELGNLPYHGGGTLWERLGRNGLETDGHDRWLRNVVDATETLREAFVADYVMIGGGNAEKVSTLPPHARLGGNHDAFMGGFRLWEELVEPHDRQPRASWRVVR